MTWEITTFGFERMPIGSLEQQFSAQSDPLPKGSTQQCLPGVSNLLASLGHTGRVVLGHTLNTQTVRKTDEQKKSFN